MTSRNFDTRIKIKRDCKITSLYSNRRSSSNHFQDEYLATLENKAYVFKIDRIAYKVNPKDVTIIY